MKKHYLLPFLFVIALSTSACDFFFPRTNRRSGRTSLDEDDISEPEDDSGDNPIFDDRNGTVTFGIYPQTRIDDEDIIAKLNRLESPSSRGWHKYNNEYYAKTVGKLTNTSDSESAYLKTFNDGTQIVPGQTYWFRCDPIVWDVLEEKSNGECTLRAQYLLDTHRFDDDNNNYEQSEIRSWLNSEFYDSAFVFSNKSKIVVTHVDNSASQTDANSADLACEDTEDKVFLQCYQDLGGDSNVRTRVSLNRDYCKDLSDYAFATGAYKSASSVSGLYWLRSPSNTTMNDRNVPDVWYILNGSLWYWDVNVYDVAVNPLITIKR